MWYNGATMATQTKQRRIDLCKQIIMGLHPLQPPYAKYKKALEEAGLDICKTTMYTDVKEAYRQLDTATYDARDVANRTVNLVELSMYQAFDRGKLREVASLASVLDKIFAFSENVAVAPTKVSDELISEYLKEGENDQ